jgi:titin
VGVRAKPAGNPPGHTTDDSLSTSSSRACCWPATQSTRRGDNGNNLNPTPFSLRAEIIAVDKIKLGAAATINFNIGGLNQPGLYTIAPPAPLPAITVPNITIDGYTQSNAALPNKIPIQSVKVIGGVTYANNASIEIILNGANAGAGAVGLELSGGSDTVKGLVIQGFSGGGIVLDTVGQDNINGDYIGTDPSGTVAVPNGVAGITINNVADNKIGGTTAAACNLISGNGASGTTVPGVAISGQGAGSNVVDGNDIGLSATNGKLINSGGGNTGAGVSIAGNAPNNTVGGTLGQAGNVICANGGPGVLITGAQSTQNTVEGNFIGTDATGTVRLGNVVGVSLTSTTSDNVGGPGTTDRNVISGNFGDGVSMWDTSGILVAGNWIGTDSSGNIKLTNGGSGVDIWDAGNNTVGGFITSPGQPPGNIISGNTADGVFIRSDGEVEVSGNEVLGNLIGTDTTGAAALPNATGVRISGSAGQWTASDNSIGAAGQENVISGNTQYGVEMDTQALLNVVAANFIGTDMTGEFALGNGKDGVLLQTGSSANTIGGGTAAGTPSNVISANGSSGTDVTSGSGIAMLGTSTNQNVVLENYIGIDAKGSAATDDKNNSFRNAFDGVYLQLGAAGATIGGTTGDATTRNVISNNGKNGVEIGSGTNLVANNYIGTDSSGTKALGNSNDGVLIDAGGNTNTIGGTVAAVLNVISGNLGNGVELQGTSNIVAGDYIGLDSSGLLPLANTKDGVLISGNNNTVGGTVAGARDFIADNTGFGVEIAAGIAGTWLGNDNIGFDIKGKLQKNLGGGVSGNYTNGGGNNIQP